MDHPAPLEGSPILDEQGQVLGHVSTAFASPLLGHTVMLGWLKRAPFPERVEIDGRPAHVAKRIHGSARTLARQDGGFERAPHSPSGGFGHAGLEHRSIHT